MTAWTPDTLIARIDATAREEFARWKVPGAVVAVMRGDEVAIRPYGVSSLMTRYPVTADTLMQVGSISKVFTATLVMTLVDAGQLSLDRPVIEWLPDLPLADAAARRTITLRHLLSHSSGFYGDRFDDHGDGDDALARAVAAFADLPQLTAPGELWTYCNAGFDLAGRVVEVVTGQTFEQAMRERVLAPLGMPRTTYFAKEAIRHDVAVGHEPGADGEPAVAHPWPIPRRSNAAGGVTAPVAELLRFARMHLNGGELDGTRVLSADAARAMATRVALADPGRVWGLGWCLRTIGGAQALEHNGATNGFTSRLVLVPAHDLAIAVLTNGSFGSAAHPVVAKRALAEGPGLVDAPQPPLADPSAELARTAGRYARHNAGIDLEREGDRLRMVRWSINPFSNERREYPVVHAVALGGGVFRVEGGDVDGASLDMIAAADGSVRFVRFSGRLNMPVQ